MVAAGPGTRVPVEMRERLGGASIAVALLVPPLFAAFAHSVSVELVEPDPDVSFGIASTRLGLNLAAAIICALGTLLFTAPSPANALVLRLLGVLRALGAGGAFGILWAESLQVWQTSVALSALDIAFAVTLLRYIAGRLEDRGAASLARSTRQYVWLYLFSRLALLSIWFLPPEAVNMVAAFHRPLAPLLDGVIAVLALRCLRSPPQSSPVAPA